MYGGWKRNDHSIAVVGGPERPDGFSNEITF
jgi:hypothetical protein